MVQCERAAADHPSVVSDNQRTAALKVNIRHTITVAVHEETTQFVRGDASGKTELIKRQKGIHGAYSPTVICGTQRFLSSSKPAGCFRSRPRSPSTNWLRRSDEHT